MRTRMRKCRESNVEERRLEKTGPRTLETNSYGRPEISVATVSTEG